jgi:large subunit ribosomal protein L18
MYSKKDRKADRSKVRRRIRGKLYGVPERPRLAVFRSVKHMYVQAIDDLSGLTLAAASTLDPECREGVADANKTGAAKIVGQTLAKRLKDKGVEKVVFDRGGFRYTGRVKAVADGARESGLEF